MNKQSKNKEAAFAWIDFFVKESGYVEENGFIPVLTTNEPTLPQMTEFLSYQPSLIESADRDATFYRIGNAAQIPFGTGALVQELAVAPDLQQEFEKLNKRWQKAKKSLGY
ncbi:hypothetical protein [Caldalkalibacillus mannanilyticus]|uniref:hypothetical protein n=1 Tax=Caldalkalibacillus mannanilyticus TaxID=1418 RepID=UPI001F1D7005|nr:hypothetical protein [Caldalkalibacillus mannanilyticus]